jgi:hypothetical protein
MRPSPILSMPYSVLINQKIRDSMGHQVPRLLGRQRRHSRIMVDNGVYQGLILADRKQPHDMFIFLVSARSPNRVSI